jgi:hypothetical protein
LVKLLQKVTVRAVRRTSTVVIGGVASVRRKPSSLVRVYLVRLVGLYILVGNI